jgi:hypothetical protein
MANFKPINEYVINAMKYFHLTNSRTGFEPWTSVFVTVEMTFSPLPTNELIETKGMEKGVRTSTPHSDLKILKPFPTSPSGL